MAKRRRLEAPSSEELNALEEGFARETRGGALGPIPPIAQVAADAAAQAEVADPETRAALALDKADAERYREALAEGLVVQRIPVADIMLDALPRDRVNVDAGAMEELKNSIRIHGLRLPVDVFALSAVGEGGEQFGLISGWRRLMAYRMLAAEMGGGAFDTIPAFVRDGGTGPKAYIAMVEENEIRANLSHYERGRIAVMAAGLGAFPSVGDAVNALYESGSKAKRSKIRSFAELHEELGDLLGFATHLSERQGLRVVGAIRNGFTGDLRAALGTGQGDDPASEWALLESVVAASEGAAKPGKKKPVKASAPKGPKGHQRLKGGISMAWDLDRQGYCIRLEGDAVDETVVKAAMDGIKRVLGAR